MQMIQLVDFARHAASYRKWPKLTSTSPVVARSARLWAFGNQFADSRQLSAAPLEQQIDRLSREMYAGNACIFGFEIRLR